MRRKYFGLAIAAIATFGPMQAYGGDREIAEQIMKRLKQNRDSGALEDFTLDLKVDKGVVLFRGNVCEKSQKDLVLKAAGDIDGIEKVVDEVSVTATQPSSTVVKPNVMKTKVVEEATALKPVPASTQEFSLRQALAKEAVLQQKSQNQKAQNVVPGEIAMASAVELAAPNAQATGNGDKQLVANVVAALGRAKNAGQLKGFGVDVKSSKGVVQLQGRASSIGQRETIVDIARKIPGVVEIRESISIPSESQALPPLPAPAALSRAPVQAPAPVQAVPVSNKVARAPQPAPLQQAPMANVATYRPQQGGVPAQTVQYAGAVAGAPVMGQPVPMAPYSGVAGAPRYDSPQLPNYAWPGYASHPNYAALTYPQQYSPSAWPYIGPFYPYPQVPMGWRKISLEWDDGWWFLDFTDK